jgi:hypothetical protein
VRIEGWRSVQWASKVWSAKGKRCGEVDDGEIGVLGPRRFLGEGGTAQGPPGVWRVTCTQCSDPWEYRASKQPASFPGPSLVSVQRAVFYCFLS